MYFIKQFEELTSTEQWIHEKELLIKFYNENYSFDFLIRFIVFQKVFLIN